MNLSFYITSPTSYRCPVSLASGFTSMSWEQGTVSDTQSSPQSFILTCLFWAYSAIFDSTKQPPSYVHGPPPAAHADARSRLQVLWNSKEFVSGPGEWWSGESTQTNGPFNFWKIWGSYFSGHYLHQVAPRWKRCVLETETGFDQVLRNLLSERLAHKEVKRYHWCLIWEAAKYASLIMLMFFSLLNRQRRLLGMYFPPSRQNCKKRDGLMRSLSRWS